MNLLLLVLSLVIFLVAAWQDRSPAYQRLLALGLAALVASMLVGRVL